MAACRCATAIIGNGRSHVQVHHRTQDIMTSAASAPLRCNLGVIMVVIIGVRSVVVVRASYILVSRLRRWFLRFVR